jgi:AGCS family alanine or glycine:cation symporter
VLAVEGFLSALSAALWGRPLIIALLGTHIFLTLRLRGIQRYIGRALKLSVTKERGAKGDISPFAALMTALAATIGTGNIVGVATAVVAGGPGAVLWMWLSGVFGMATKYTEALLSVKYRVKMPDGTMAGGPMYVMERGLHSKWLGVVFAFFTALAALGIGCMVQSNSIAVMFYRAFNIPPVLCGAAAAILTGCVIIGGIKSIARVCNIIIPVAGVLFIVSNIAILIIGWQTIPHTLALIFTSAFTGRAAAGGFAGATAKDAIRFGVARGLFSNESGLGSSAIVDAAAQCKNPVRQALVSYTGTFWDTVVLAALTGIMIVNSGLWLGGSDGGELTNAVFSIIPVVGPIMLAAALFTFAVATCIGWSYYAQKAVEYLFGSRAVGPYKALYVLLIFMGSMFSIGVVWSFSDIANAMMAIPNLISLVMLSGVAVEETRKYIWSGRLFEDEFEDKKGKNPKS